MEATGIGFMGIIGLRHLFIADPGGQLEYHLSQGLLWVYHLIISWACPLDIIGYTTLIFRGTGKIGVALTTGTVIVGTEIMPSIIGVVKNGMRMRRSIMRGSIMAGSIEMKGEVAISRQPLSLPRFGARIFFIDQSTYSQQSLLKSKHSIYRESPIPSISIRMIPST